MVAVEARRWHPLPGHYPVRADRFRLHHVGSTVGWQATSDVSSGDADLTCYPREPLHPCGYTLLAYPSRFVVHFSSVDCITHALFPNNVMRDTFVKQNLSVKVLDPRLHIPGRAKDKLMNLKPTLPVQPLQAPTPGLLPGTSKHSGGASCAGGTAVPSGFSHPAVVRLRAAVGDRPQQAIPNGVVYRPEHPPSRRTRIHHHHGERHLDAQRPPGSGYTTPPDRRPPPRADTRVDAGPYYSPLFLFHFREAAVPLIQRRHRRMSTLLPALGRRRIAPGCGHPPCARTRRADQPALPGEHFPNRPFRNRRYPVVITLDLHDPQRPYPVAEYNRFWVTPYFARDL